MLTKNEKDHHWLHDIRVEFEMHRLWKEDCPHQFTLHCVEACAVYNSFNLVVVSPSWVQYSCSTKKHVSPVCSARKAILYRDWSFWNWKALSWNSQRFVKTFMHIAQNYCAFQYHCCWTTVSGSTFFSLPSDTCEHAFIDNAVTADQNGITFHSVLLFRNHDDIPRNKLLGGYCRFWSARTILVNETCASCNTWCYAMTTNM